MANPVIGHVECPHCGDAATVHREARGLRAMYYRCYGDDGMSMRCGTVQIRGPSGQAWIAENMASAPAGKSSQETLVSPDLPVETIKRAVSEVTQRRRRGLWDLVSTGADDE